MYTIPRFLMMLVVTVALMGVSGLTLRASPPPEPQLRIVNNSGHKLKFELWNGNAMMTPYRPYGLESGATYQTKNGNFNLFIHMVQVDTWFKGPSFTYYHTTGTWNESYRADDGKTYTANVTYAKNGNDATVTINSTSP